MADGDKFDKKLDEIDSFWTLDETMPGAKRRTPFSTDTETTLLEIDDTTQVKPTGVAIPKKSDAPKERIRDTYKPIPLLEYFSDDSFVKKVSVWMWQSKYSFYERFVSDAERIHTMVGRESPHEHFFSYIPQYSQLGTKQLAWYLWWRENVRRGVYPDTDYSYIVLYIYEIINLPEIISPEVGLDILCRIWLNYRDRHKSVDVLLGEIVCDYCLINRLPAPLDKIGSKRSEILAEVSLKEFYFSMSEVTENTDAYSTLLMNLASNYDWKKSKYLTPETSDDFKRHIPAAFAHAVKTLASNGDRMFAEVTNLRTAKMTRDAYSGSLCAYNVKRRIDVEYLSFTRSPELRLIVTDLIKCAENGVRAMLRIKSRLAVGMLDDVRKAAVGSYFAPIKAKVEAKAKTPEYEAQYDAATSTLSVDDALKLEEKSWQVADMLGGFEDAPTFEVPEVTVDVEEKAEVKPEVVTSSDIDILAVLKLLMDGNSVGFAEYASAHNIFSETLAERVNDALYDVIGDIAVELDVEHYIIIEDYREDIESYIAESENENA